MASDNLDSADLKGVDFGGWIAEDVMERIWDISGIPLAMTDRIGSAGTVDNSYFEWNQDRLADVDLDNAVVDGADTIDKQDTKVGKRVGNHCQTSVKVVKVSTRADNSATFGASRELARQVRRRQRELRRDVEGITCHNQASKADDGDTVEGRTGVFASWLTSSFFGGDTGAPGGFSAGSVAAYTPGTPRAGTEKMLKDAVQQIFELGGDPTVLMGQPALVRGLNEYLFSDSAQIATLQGNTSADGGGDNQLVAKGSINVYVADHGQVLQIVPNRLQQPIAANVGHLFIMDPEYAGLSYLFGYRVEPLAKTGLAEKRQMAVDWGLCVHNEEAHGLIADIDYSLPWTKQ